MKTRILQKAMQHLLGPVKLVKVIKCCCIVRVLVREKMNAGKMILGAVIMQKQT